jgi:hypothetical protein
MKTVSTSSQKRMSTTSAKLSVLARLPSGVERIGDLDGDVEQGIAV